MATLSQYAVTLADIAKMSDPDGSLATIIDLLSRKERILDDMLWKQGNQRTGHQVTVQTGYPTPAWRLLNEGVQPSKGTTAQITEACANLESWSEVDVDVAKLNRDVGAYRLQHARTHLAAMAKEAAATIFYGNGTTAPNEFTGLATRYSSLSANLARCIVDAGGTGSDNSSIWLVIWGDDGVFGIYPRNSQAGLIHSDLGEQTVQTSATVAGTRLRVYQDRFEWKMGIAVADWRQACRICNIDISNLVAKSSAADLIEQMITAYHRVEDLNAGRAAFYMNRTVMHMFDVQKRDDVISGGGLTFENVDGVPQVKFRGIPCKVCDALTETEARIT
jgi:hypothetical protein